MKKIISKVGVIAIVVIPIISFAQTRDLGDVVLLVVRYFNYAIYLILGLALLMFVWNVFKYFIKGGEDVTARKEANLYVMWSIIGFFVILSIWGLVRILTNTFRLDSHPPSTFFGTFGGSFFSPFGGGSNNSGVPNKMPSIKTGDSNNMPAIKTK
ncbi:MAG TPA: pilin [Candidatus Paceibacterota bacterium]